MIVRRAFLAGTAAAFACSRAVFAQPSRLSFPVRWSRAASLSARREAGASVTVDDVPVRVSPQGLFAFGFEYNQTAPVKVSARLPDGTTDTQSVTPKVRMYEIQRITGLPEKYVTPPANVIERIKREGAMITHVRMRDTGESWFADGLRLACRRHHQRNLGQSAHPERRAEGAAFRRRYRGATRYADPCAGRRHRLAGAAQFLSRRRHHHARSRPRRFDRAISTRANCW